MIAYLLNCQCDSIVTKACGALIPVVRETYEAGTNCSDVSIAEAICKSLVLIVAICVAGFLIWKQIDHHAKKKVDKRKREWDVEDKTLKQKSDLLDKYLDFLKEQASKDDKLIEDYTNVLAGFKESLKKKTDNKCEVYNNLVETDNAKIIKILDSQMEFLRGKGFKSNVEAEKDYKQALEYLIHLSQQGKLNEYTTDTLKKSLNDEKLTHED